MPESESSRAAAASKGTVVCISEDRASCEPAVRILIASLQKHSPGLAVELFSPDPPAAFQSWLQQFPAVTLNPHRPSGEFRKYDVKPQALLTLLEKGYEEVVWVDSDIVVCGDIRPLFAGLSTDTIAVTEEALCEFHGDAGGLRARLWGMTVGRELPFLANSAVVRVTQEHTLLLQRWRSLLDRPEYREAQQKDFRQRPVHLMGDQEVLTAVLASAEFAHLPIRYLRRGSDIIQYFGPFGYTLGERVRNLVGGMPPFVHSQAFRPWWPRQPQKDLGLFGRFTALYSELSPYTVIARQYRDALESDDWLRPRTAASAWLRGLGLGKPPLVGLPMALVADLVRFGKQFRGGSKAPARS